MAGSLQRSGVGQQAVGLALIAAPLAVLAVLLLYPAGVSILATFRDQAGDGTPVWSLARYVRFFNDPQSVANYLRTVWTTGVTLAALAGEMIA